MPPVKPNFDELISGQHFRPTGVGAKNLRKYLEIPLFRKEILAEHLVKHTGEETLFEKEAHKMAFSPITR